MSLEVQATSRTKALQSFGKGSLLEQAISQIRQKTSKQGIHIPTVWEPQAGPQEDLVTTYKGVFEVFYGGARGGGKTDGMLGDFLLNQVIPHGPHARGMFFRRRAERLEDVVRRSKEIYTRTGAAWKEQKKTWEWPNGATLRFRHLWDLKESEDYKTYSLTWVCFEQAEEWPDPEPIMRIIGAVRSAEGVPTVIRLTGNPGGIGHSWIKARYYDPAPAGRKLIHDDRTRQDRVFIPAKLEDNPTLRKGDPDYEYRILNAGSPQLVKGWRHGVWDIVAGGFFSDAWMPDIKLGLQLLKPFPIPESWELMRSFDWGSAKPSSLGLWALTDGEPLPADHPIYPNKLFPAGSFVRIGEWYTVRRDSSGFPIPNKGLRLTNDQLGAGIAAACHTVAPERTWDYSVADPSIFTESGDRSIYERLVEGSAAWYHERAQGNGSNPPPEDEIEFDRANTDRSSGWQRLLEMLRESAKERPEGPGLWCMEHCTEWLRTFPTLPADERKPDDVDTKAEDHAGDETRYAVMSDLAVTHSQELLR